ncbi:hypothetical protein ACKTEK_13385 [Tepidamorphus sp. 3E244]|uniref:hypothetical protein n=1 Tax=Tepidamorphus sp. 3E244 TaxID=3385498 RepID=UPI0038FC4C9F
MSAFLGCSTAFAQSPQPNPEKVISKDLIESVRSWIDTDVVRESIVAQNRRYAAISQDEVDALDKQWRAEREADDKPLIAATLSNPLSVYLNRVQGRSLGMFFEIIVMDDKGLNVGQSAVTGDFWQGDEAKFQKTFPEGGMEAFIDEAEWDEEFKIWRAQLNIPVYDKSGSKKIGAATVEINLTEAQRRFGSQPQDAF